MTKSNEEKKLQTELIEMGSYISPKMIYDKVSETVIGQDSAKRTIAITIFLHFVRYLQSIKEGRLMKKSNALIMGPSGCGKTFIVRETVRAIQNLTGYAVCPMLEIDCTEITGRGWEGDNASDLIKSHHKRYGKMEHAFDTTVVFLDEFDKICRPAVSSHGNDHNKLTQYNLLKMVEGTDLPVKGVFGDSAVSTDKMLFIMAGNFAEIRHLRAAKKKVLGFTEQIDEDKEVNYHRELENIGMATQLVGRTPHIAEIYNLKPKELKKILVDHLIPEYQSTWKYLGQELKISRRSIAKIAKSCYNRKTGARGLQADLSEYIDKQIFEAKLYL